MGSNINSDKILRALALELKTPLTTIARMAELRGDEAIAAQASEVMKLIDGYLLSSQTEYGQQQLPLSAAGIGSIIYDVSQDLRPFAVKNKVLVNTSVGSDVAVMTNRRGLQIALGCLAQLAVMGVENSDEKSRREIQIVSYRRRSGSLVAAVFSKNFELTPRDLKRAEVLYGDSHLALSTQLPGSGIRLAIAQQLASSLDSAILTLKRGGLKGLGFELIKSEQLQLV